MKNTVLIYTIYDYTNSTFKEEDYIEYEESFKEENDFIRKLEEKLELEEGVLLDSKCIIQDDEYLLLGNYVIKDKDELLTYTIMKN